MRGYFGYQTGERRGKMGKCDCEENIMVKELVHNPLFLAQKSEPAKYLEKQD